MISIKPLLLIVWLSISLLSSCERIDKGVLKHNKDVLKHDNVHEILVPLNSITPLVCDLIFNQDKATATWYKNGEIVGTVQSNTNVIYEKRPLELKEIPEVGFLLIPAIELNDQADYWCELPNMDPKLLKVYRLRVAFIQPFDENQKPTAYPQIPELGKTLTIDCPATNSYPTASVSWKFNDETIEFGTGRIEVTKNNGSLLIRRFQKSDSGLYSCVLSNFAGQTSAQIQLFPSIMYSLQSEFFDYAQTLPAATCSSYFKNGLLWFLIGCLSTSCVVLIYLMAGLICYRYSTRRTNTQFSPLNSILRADPSLAPGFRKVIAPVHDYIRDQTVSGYTAEAV